MSYLFRGRLVDRQDSVEVFDAIGLWLFCVIGTYNSLQHHSAPTPAIILGTITAIGGGIVRDVLLCQIPAVLREGLYAIPALLGATVVAVGYEFGIATIAWYRLAAGSCLIVRIIGMVFHINLPVAVGVTHRADRILDRINVCLDKTTLIRNQTERRTACSLLECRCP